MRPDRMPFTENPPPPPKPGRGAGNHHDLPDKRFDLGLLRRRGDPACAYCPHRHGILPNSSPPRGAINCPVMAFVGRWGWPCHPTMAESMGGER